LLHGDELEFKVSFDIEPATLSRPKMKLGQGIAGYVAARGKSIIVNDVRQSPHFFSVIDDATGFKTRSALCVPMISQGKVIGVIELLNSAAVILVIMMKNFSSPLFRLLLLQSKMQGYTKQLFQ